MCLEILLEMIENGDEKRKTGSPTPRTVIIINQLETTNVNERTGAGSNERAPALEPKSECQGRVQKTPQCPNASRVVVSRHRFRAEKSQRYETSLSAHLGEFFFLLSLMNEIIHLVQSRGDNHKGARRLMASGCARRRQVIALQNIFVFGFSCQTFGEISIKLNHEPKYISNESNLPFTKS